MTIKEKVSFAIVAHVDSGKTELCKRISEKFTNKKNNLDNLEVEKNRGITVKLKQFCFEHQNKEFFFIDTPGHSEFSSEVERTLEMVDNVFLLIDLTQGIQSSTTFLAKKLSLTRKKIFVIYNKIDMIDRLKDVEEINVSLEKMGIKFNHICISAKKSINIDKLTTLFDKMQKIESENIFAQIFDINSTKFGYKCFFKTCKKIKKGQKIFFASGLECKVLSIGKSYNDDKKIEETDEIDMGYFIIKTKIPGELKTGEIYQNKKEILNLENKFTSSNMYFQIFTNDEDEKKFNNCIRNIILNDPSIKSRLISHSVLGNGYMLGVKGKIHMEIIVERLKSENDLDIMVSNPGFFYKTIENGDEKIIYDPNDYDPSKHKIMFETFSKIIVSTLKDYVSRTIDYIKSIRGEIENIKEDLREYEYTDIFLAIPITEMNTSFLATLKQITHGYLNITNLESNVWKNSNVSRLDILLNNEEIKGFSFLLPDFNIKTVAGDLVKKVISNLETRNFQVKVQAKVGSKIIKTEILKARKNDVTSKCYGGDQSRKKKLWEKQRKGRLKQNKNFHHNFTAGDFKNIFKSIS